MALGINLEMTALSVDPMPGFILEVTSFALMFVIMVWRDSRAVGELAGIAIGSTVALVLSSSGPLTNASMNLPEAQSVLMILWEYYVSYGFM